MNEGRGVSAGGARALAIVVAIVALLALAGPAPAAVGAPVAERVEQPAASVREYWTERRLRRAQPADLVVSASGRVLRPAAGAAGRRAGRTAIESSAASAAFPGRVHGKVFFTVAGGSDPGDFVCSATVVQSNRHTLVWTAGHCVNDAQFGGGFASNWVFIPGYRNGDAPFGAWPATRLITTEAWAGQVDIRQDLGAALVGRDPQGRGIEDALGARPIRFDLSRTEQYTAFGYPATPSVLEPSFDGERLYTCVSAVTGDDHPPGNGPDTLRIDCDMTAGASGGGWVIPSGAVNGVTSYSYVGDFVHLYGPYLGDEARAVYDEASGPPLVCGGAAVTNLGGAGPDDLLGGDGAETFKLEGDADRARGFGGADGACGGAGDDRLKGGDSHDALRGGAGADVLNGGPGVDLCIGGPGRDRGPGCERRRRIP